MGVGERRWEWRPSSDKRRRGGEQRGRTTRARRSETSLEKGAWDEGEQRAGGRQEPKELAVLCGQKWESNKKKGRWGWATGLGSRILLGRAAVGDGRAVPEPQFGGVADGCGGRQEESAEERPREQSSGGTVNEGSQVMEEEKERRRKWRASSRCSRRSEKEKGAVGK